MCSNFGFVARMDNLVGTVVGQRFRDFRPWIVCCRVWCLSCNFRARRTIRSGWLRGDAELRRETEKPRDIGLCWRPECRAGQEV